MDETQKLEVAHLNGHFQSSVSCLKKINGLVKLQDDHKIAPLAIVKRRDEWIYIDLYKKYLRLLEVSHELQMLN